MSSDTASVEMKADGKTADKVFKGFAYGAGILILAVLAAVFVFLLLEALPMVTSGQDAVKAAVESFTGGQFSNFWAFAGPLVFGTILSSALALILAFFVAIGIALFISHYAPKKLATALSTVVDLLAAIPSVIYGLWGALVFVPASYPFWNWLAKVLGWLPIFAPNPRTGVADNPPKTIASVAVVLAVMILPIICSVSRDIFVQTPRLQQEAALALGATKWEMVKLAVLPFGKSGIISASMLGLGRALGETMAILMIISPGYTYAFNLLQTTKQSSIAATIALMFGEASDDVSRAVLFGIGLVLFVITFIVNFIARKITEGKQQ